MLKNIPITLEKLQNHDKEVESLLAILWQQIFLSLVSSNIDMTNLFHYFMTRFSEFHTNLFLFLFVLKFFYVNL